MRKRAQGRTVSGRTFVLTGTLPNLSREEAKQLIETAGGKVSGVGEQEDQLRGGGQGLGSKLAKAEELGVAVIGEEELLKMIEG